MMVGSNGDDVVMCLGDKTKRKYIMKVICQERIKEEEQYGTKALKKALGVCLSRWPAMRCYL